MVRWSVERGFLACSAPCVLRVITGQNFIPDVSPPAHKLVVWTHFVASTAAPLDCSVRQHGACSAKFTLRAGESCDRDVRIQIEDKDSHVIADKVLNCEAADSFLCLAYATAMLFSPYVHTP